MKDASPDLLTEDVTELLATHREGHCLARGFYTSPMLYDADIQHYWNQTWICVGHICQLPRPGAYFLFDYGPESLIIARDHEGQIGAFLNVCRHRGSRVCTEAKGHKSVFSCPYHAWTYELNGTLRGAREMPEGFDKSEHGLLRAHLRLLEGFIFVCTADTPPPIDAAIAELRPLLAPYCLADMKIVHEASYPVPANWKLAIENYMECYHCGPAHLDYSKSHSLKDPRSITPDLLADLSAACQAAGLPEARVEHNNLANDGTQLDVYFSRYPLYPGFQTGSQSGDLLAPLLGNLKAPFNGANDLQLGILNNFLIYSDHVVAYRFVPRGVQQTDIQVIWYVREDAEQGRDYDHETLTWLWHVTSLDDERIIRVNQDGVNSFHFRPGPLAEMEWGIRAFYASYLDQMRRALPRQ